MHRWCNQVLPNYICSRISLVLCEKAKCEKDTYEKDSIGLYYIHVPFQLSMDLMFYLYKFILLNKFVWFYEICRHENKLSNVSKFVRKYSLKNTFRYKTGGVWQFYSNIFLTMLLKFSLKVIKLTHIY